MAATPSAFDGAREDFPVAGAGHKFVPAQARTEGGKVAAWRTQVAAPGAVRCAWADHSEGANFVQQRRIARPYVPHR